MNDYTSLAEKEPRDGMKPSAAETREYIENDYNGPPLSENTPTPKQYDAPLMGPRKPREFQYKKPDARDFGYKPSKEIREDLVKQHLRDEGLSVTITSLDDYKDVLSALDHYGSINDLTPEQTEALYPPGITGKEFFLPRNTGPKGSVKHEMYKRQERVRLESRTNIKEMKKRNAVVGSLYESFYNNVGSYFQEGMVTGVNYGYGRYTAGNWVQGAAKIAGASVTDFYLADKLLFGAAHKISQASKASGLTSLARRLGIPQFGGNIVSKIASGSTKALKKVPFVGNVFATKAGTAIAATAARVPKMSALGAAWNGLDEEISGRDPVSGALFGAAMAPVFFLGMSGSAKALSRGTGALVDMTGLSRVMKKVTNWALGAVNLTPGQKKEIYNAASEGTKRGGRVAKNLTVIEEATLNKRRTDLTPDEKAEVIAVLTCNGERKITPPAKGGEFNQPKRSKKAPSNSQPPDGGEEIEIDLDVPNTRPMSVEKGKQYSLNVPVDPEVNAAALNLENMSRLSTFPTAGDKVESGAANLVFDGDVRGSIARDQMRGVRKETAKLEVQLPGRGEKPKGAKAKIAATGTMLEQEGSIVASSGEDRVKRFKGAMRQVNQLIKSAPKSIDHYIRRDIRLRVTEPMRKALKKYGINEPKVRKMYGQKVKAGGENQSDIGAVVTEGNSRELRQVGQSGEAPDLQDTLKQRGGWEDQDLRGAGVSGEEEMRAVNELLKLDEVSEQGIALYEARLLREATDSDQARRGYFKGRATDGMRRGKSGTKSKAQVDTADVTPYTEDSAAGWQSEDVTVKDTMSREEKAVRAELESWHETGEVKKYVVEPEIPDRRGQLGHGPMPEPEVKPPAGGKRLKKGNIARENAKKAKNEVIDMMETYLNAVVKNGGDDGEINWISKATKEVIEGYNAGESGKIRLFGERVQSRLKRIGVDVKVSKRKIPKSTVTKAKGKRSRKVESKEDAAITKAERADAIGGAKAKKIAASKKRRDAVKKARKSIEEDRKKMAKRGSK